MNRRADARTASRCGGFVIAMATAFSWLYGPLNGLPTRRTAVDLSHADAICQRVNGRSWFARR
jgi:hypothetical protein